MSPKYISFLDRFAVRHLVDTRPGRSVIDVGVGDREASDPDNVGRRHYTLYVKYFGDETPSLYFEFESENLRDRVSKALCDPPLREVEFL